MAQTSGNPAKRAAADREKAAARARSEAIKTASEELDEMTFTVTLHGREGKAKITVPSYLDWGDDAVALVREGDFRGWATAALDADNLQKWINVAPTNRTATAFFDEWQNSTGEDLGESQAS